MTSGTLIACSVLSSADLNFSGNRMNLNSHCKVMRQVTDHRWMNLYIIHELKHILNFNFVGGKDLSGCEHPRVCLLNHNR